MRATAKPSNICGLETSGGLFVADFTANGLHELHFPEKSNPALITYHFSSAANVEHWLDLTLGAIERILSGNNPVQLPPLDLEGTSFQKAVWEILQQIPAGHTLSYSEIACRLGKPGAARAVGSACGANPVPLLIPCHRVLAKGSRLGGFSGGLHWKRRLLAVEGIEIQEASLASDCALDLFPH